MNTTLNKYTNLAQLICRINASEATSKSSDNYVDSFKLIWFFCVQAGQDLKLPVAWFGHPKPTFTWTLNDKPVRIDGNRVKTTDENLPPPAHPGPGGSLEMSPGGVVVLNVGKVTRADKGRYQLNLSNELGQANTSCNVEVLGELN